MEIINKVISESWIAVMIILLANYMNGYSDQLIGRKPGVEWLTWHVPKWIYYLIPLGFLLLVFVQDIFIWAVVLIVSKGLWELGESMGKRKLKELKSPQIICLCGSTKFQEEYERFNSLFTLDGAIVLSVGVFGKDYTLSKEAIEDLDNLHLKKIDMADTIFVINKDGYIGESTQKEIEYATKLKKPIVYWEG